MDRWLLQIFSQQHAQNLTRAIAWLLRKRRRALFATQHSLVIVCNRYPHRLLGSGKRRTQWTRIRRALLLCRFALLQLQHEDARPQHSGQHQRDCDLCASWDHRSGVSSIFVRMPTIAAAAACVTAALYPGFVRLDISPSPAPTSITTAGAAILLSGGTGAIFVTALIFLLPSSATSPFARTLLRSAYGALARSHGRKEVRFLCWTSVGVGRNAV